MDCPAVGCQHQGPGLDAAEEERHSDGEGEEQMEGGRWKEEVEESFIPPPLPFQIRTNKDGSKTQVVRQYGSNTTNAKSTEPPQATYQQKSFVYINGMAEGVMVDGAMASTGSCPSLVPASAATAGATTNLLQDTTG